ncbi:hypothetical protein HDV04_005945 [Boothiomyces sp. JEL0838]|nr:hypothetical protein HDV04_005945 [Boothiomyces sp. JEL0838]
MAQIEFQAGWLHTSCQGPPDTMIIFNETNPTYLYTNYSVYNPIPFCGLDLKEVYIGCCFQTLDLSSTSNYFSFSWNYLTDFTLEQSFLKDAIGSSYCNLTSMEIGSLFGYQQMYFREGGECLEDYFRCNQDNIEIYNSNGCTGLVEIFPLSNNTVIYASFVGNISISSFTIQKGEMSTVWTSYVPGQYLVPNFSDGLEILAFVLFILAASSALAALIWKITVYRQHKRMMDFWFILCIAEMIFQLTVNFYYQYEVFTSAKLLVIVSFIVSLTNLGSLMFTITNWMILFSIFNIISKRIRVVILFCSCLFHFALVGPSYYGYFIQILNPALFLDIYDLGITLSDTWKLLSLIFGYVPPLTILAIVLKVQYYKRHNYRDEKYLGYDNKRVYSIISIQIVLGILICLMAFDIQNLTVNDRQYLAILLCGYTFSVFNFLALIILIAEMARITKQMVGTHSTKPLEKPVMLVNMVTRVKSAETRTVQGTVIMKQ